MNYQSYWCGGMGLHESQLKQIQDIIVNNNVKTIVEFGSGQSTRFLCDLREEKSFDYQIYSFDHHPQYCYKGEHEFLHSNRLDLVCCDDESFNAMFENKLYNESAFVNCQGEKDNFRLKNGFYDMNEHDLPNDIDLVILDGPNGNGRSISYLHLKNRVSRGCNILIDDSDHYDFVERCSQIFDTEVLAHVNNPQIHPLFNYAIVRVSR